VAECTAVAGILVLCRRQLESTSACTSIHSDTARRHPLGCTLRPLHRSLAERRPGLSRSSLRTSSFRPRLRCLRRRRLRLSRRERPHYRSHHRPRPRSNCNRPSAQARRQRARTSNTTWACRSRKQLSCQSPMVECHQKSASIHCAHTVPSCRWHRLAQTAHGVEAACTSSAQPSMPLTPSP